MSPDFVSITPPGNDIASPTSLMPVQAPAGHVIVQNAENPLRSKPSLKITLPSVFVTKKLSSIFGGTKLPTKWPVRSHVEIEPFSELPKMLLPTTVLSPRTVTETGNCPLGSVNVLYGVVAPR